MLSNKLAVTKSENKWHYFIYGFAIIVIMAVMGIFTTNFKDVLTPNWYAIVFSIVAISCAIVLLYFTWKHLIHKSIYAVSELDPIINGFTKLADRNVIKLFGGDLNFFGNAPVDMYNNVQYSFLKGQNFNKVLILCEMPNDSSTKIRYGKLYSEVRSLELRFYHPEEADLRVRGRMININGSSRLLMYTKHAPGYYRALETDTANSNGALYNNIWDLAWSMAIQPTEVEVKSYKDAFKS